MGTALNILPIHCQTWWQHIGTIRTAEMHVFCQTRLCAVTLRALPVGHHDWEEVPRAVGLVTRIRPLLRHPEETDDANMIQTSRTRWKRLTDPQAGADLSSAPARCERAPFVFNPAAPAFDPETPNILAMSGDIQELHQHWLRTAFSWEGGTPSTMMKTWFGDHHNQNYRMCLQPTAEICTPPRRLHAMRSTATTSMDRTHWSHIWAHDPGCHSHSHQHWCRDSCACHPGATTTSCLCDNSHNSAWHKPTTRRKRLATCHYDTWTPLSWKSTYGSWTGWTMSPCRSTHAVPSMVWSISAPPGSSISGTKRPTHIGSNASQAQLPAHPTSYEPAPNKSRTCPSWTPNTWAGGSHPWATTGRHLQRGIWCNSRGPTTDRGYRDHLHPLAPRISLSPSCTRVCWSCAAWNWTTGHSRDMKVVWSNADTMTQHISAKRRPARCSPHFLQSRSRRQAWHSCGELWSCIRGPGAHAIPLCQRISQGSDCSERKNPSESHHTPFQECGTTTWPSWSNSPRTDTLATATATAVQCDQTLRWLSTVAHSIRACAWIWSPRATWLLQRGTDCSGHLMMYLTSFGKPLQNANLLTEMTDVSFTQTARLKADADIARPSGLTSMMSAIHGVLRSLRRNIQNKSMMHNPTLNSLDWHANGFYTSQTDLIMQALIISAPTRLKRRSFYGAHSGDSHKTIVFPHLPTVFVSDSQLVGGQASGMTWTTTMTTPSPTSEQLFKLWKRFCQENSWRSFSH